MEIEYEAVFANINKEDIRQRLKRADAKLVQAEILQKRINFHLPKGNEISGGWIRVRDEGSKITMSLKIVKAGKIENQKEICLNVDNFEKAKMFLEMIGCEKKSYQETKREIWQLDDVEIMIDEWPFLEPFVEIEASSEQSVKTAAQKLGFDYKKALFCAVDTLYRKKYDISEDVINQTPRISFKMQNPFL